MRDVTNVLIELEKKINNFSISKEEEMELNADESMILFSFSEEYEKILDKKPKHRLEDILTNSFGVKDVYLGGELESKKGRHFLKMFKEVPENSYIYLSKFRIEGIKFDANEEMNKIMIELKKVYICKAGEDILVLKKK